IVAQDRCCGDPVEWFEPPAAFQAVQVELRDVLGQWGLLILFTTLWFNRDADFVGEDAHCVDPNLERAWWVASFYCDVDRPVTVEQEVIPLCDQCSEVFGGCGRVGAVDDQLG